VKKSEKKKEKQSEERRRQPDASEINRRDDLGADNQITARSTGGSRWAAQTTPRKKVKSTIFN